MSTVYVYESFYSVVVESNRHDTCLIESNRIKSLAKAFNASIVKEAKSARKGNPGVLSDIRIWLFVRVLSSRPISSPALYNQSYALS